VTRGCLDALAVAMLLRVAKADGMKGIDFMTMLPLRLH
jgi:hypothetical protein